LREAFRIKASWQSSFIKLLDRHALLKARLAMTTSLFLFGKLESYGFK
jgi:hypothetical protein